jgi:sporulation integral membrane protein YlbJ
MTQRLIETKKANRPRAGGICLVLLLFFSLALLLRRADVAANSMREGLSLCARAIVPSLFPFMVLSELLVTSGAGEWLITPLARPLGKLLGLSRAGCCAVVLGLVCGFPIGARCAIVAYEKGTITRTECERALSASAIPSSAFLISTVGTTLWKDVKFGARLYVAAILSALLSGILLHVVQNRNKKEEKGDTSPSPIKLHFDKGMFPSAVKNATMSTLFICAYVVFFSTLTGAIGLILERFGANETTHAILSALLELSGGVSAAAGLANRKFATLLTGAAVGWSGISIHCQMLSLTDGHDLSTRPYFVAKLVQAVFCACLLLLFVR